MKPSPRQSQSGYTTLSHDAWEHARASLTGALVWPEELAAVDLRCYAARHAFRGEKLPSTRTLAASWGWSQSAVSRFIVAADWVDQISPIGWRSHEPAKAQPIAPAPSPELTPIQEPEPTVTPLDKIKALQQAALQAGAKQEVSAAKKETRIERGDIRPDDVRKAVESGQKLTGATSLGWSHANANSAKCLLRDVPTPLVYVAWVAEHWADIKPHLPVTAGYSIGVLYGFRDTLYGFFQSGEVPQKILRFDRAKRVQNSEWDESRDNRKALDPKTWGLD